MLDFCGPEGIGPFAPNNTRVDFTPCFEEGVLIPCVTIFMIVLGIYRLWDISRKPTHLLEKVSIVYFLKAGIALCISILFFIHTIFYLTTLNEIYGHQLLASITSWISSTIAFVLHTIEEKKVLRTSPILLLYWLFMALIQITIIRTDTLLGFTGDKYFVLTCIELGLITVIFILANLPFQKRVYNPLENHYTMSPERLANFFSTLTFGWITKLMVVGYRKPLLQEDLWDLPEEDHPKNVSAVFEKYWKEELEKKKPSLLLALIKSCSGPFLVGGLLKLPQDLLGFALPLLLEQILNFIDSYCEGCETQEPLYRGYLLAVAMFLATVFQTILLQSYFWLTYITGMRVLD